MSDMQKVKLRTARKQKASLSNKWLICFQLMFPIIAEKKLEL
jgi:hypothetical protein